MSGRSTGVVKSVFGVLVFLAAFAFVGTLDYDSEKKEEQLRCEMEKRFVETGGRGGWPPSGMCRK